MRTISSCEVNKGELSKLPGPSSTTSTNDQNPYDSTVRMPRTIRGLSRSSFMTHSSIVTPYSVAEHVWSLKDIRKLILSYCAKDDLSRVICVSKESFVDTMRMLYSELLYEDYRHVERACHEPYRLRQYTHAIRHVDLSNTEGGAIGLNIRLFNRLPRLRSICDGFDRLVLHDDNTSHNICAGFQTTKATLYETFDCGPDSTGEGLL
ncbi:uncharacterized protein L199_001805 [Kwoniella botswanensis]|uniref:uncharacterized protein n=1 Tax=Kwoniella botswanensis TaxID=1268659 RepID=UPI00315DEEA3